MLVGDIMRGDVKTAEGGDTFADVAKQMRANGISSVVVLGTDGALAGIVTERDIVNLVAAGETITRWASVGSARAFTSSGRTKSRPWSAAHARAASSV